ncbi:MAG: hypothetical protein ACP5OR_04075 [Candidatus Dormibacteria bacterium]
MALRLAEVNDLLARARKVSLLAQVPTSGFHVGAVVVSEKGIYEACNVEAGRISVCAENAALNMAKTAEGDGLSVHTIAVYGSSPTCPPCGSCRDVIHELARDAQIVFRQDDRPTVTGLLDLFPYPTDLTHMSTVIQNHTEEPVLEYLAGAARAASRKSYDPFSHLMIGSAVQTRQAVYTGCLVASGACGRATVSSELNALNAARMAEGDAMEVERIVTVGNGTLLSPSGTTRQALIELAPNAVIMFPDHGRYRTMNVTDLLPLPFGLTSSRVQREGIE